MSTTPVPSGDKRRISTLAIVVTLMAVFGIVMLISLLALLVGFNASTARATTAEKRVTTLSAQVRDESTARVQAQGNLEGCAEAFRSQKDVSDDLRDAAREGFSTLGTYLSTLGSGGELDSTDVVEKIDRINARELLIDSTPCEAVE